MVRPLTERPKSAQRQGQTHQHQKVKNTPPKKSVNHFFGTGVSTPDDGQTLVVQYGLYQIQFTGLMYASVADQTGSTMFPAWLGFWNIIWFVSNKC